MPDPSYTRLEILRLSPRTGEALSRLNVFEGQVLHGKVYRVDSLAPGETGPSGGTLLARIAFGSHMIEAIISQPLPEGAHIKLEVVKLADDSFILRLISVDPPKQAPSASVPGAISPDTAEWSDAARETLGQSPLKTDLPVDSKSALNLVKAPDWDSLPQPVAKVLRAAISEGFVDPVNFTARVPIARVALHTAVEDFHALVIQAGKGFEGAESVRAATRELADSIARIIELVRPMIAALPTSRVAVAESVAQVVRDLVELSSLLRPTSTPTPQQPTSAQPVSRQSVELPASTVPSPATSKPSPGDTTLVSPSTSRIPTAPPGTPAAPPSTPTAPPSAPAPTSSAPAPPSTPTAPPGTPAPTATTPAPVTSAPVPTASESPPVNTVISSPPSTTAPTPTTSEHPPPTATTASPPSTGTTTPQSPAPIPDAPPPAQTTPLAGDSQPPPPIDKLPPAPVKIPSGQIVEHQADPVRTQTAPEPHARLAHLARELLFALRTLAVLADRIAKHDGWSPGRSAILENHAMRLSTLADAWEGTLLAPMLTHVLDVPDAIPRLLISILFPGGTVDLGVLQPDRTDEDSQQGKEGEEDEEGGGKQDFVGVIRLTTQGLGSLNVRLDYRETESDRLVSGRFGAEEEAVSVIRSSIPNLESALEARGISSGGFQVGALGLDRRSPAKPSRAVSNENGLDVHA